MKCKRLDLKRFNRADVVVNSSKDDPRAKQLSTGKKKFNIDPDKVSHVFVLSFYRAT